MSVWYGIFYNQNQFLDIFKKIFSHNVTSGGLFSSKEDALSKNPDNPNAPLFSILDQLEKYRDDEGNFHFKLCYPEVAGIDGGHCNQWLQSFNPLTVTKSMGFLAKSLSFEKNGAGKRVHNFTVSFTKFS